MGSPTFKYFDISSLISGPISFASFIMVSASLLRPSYDSVTDATSSSKAIVFTFDTILIYACTCLVLCRCSTIAILYSIGERQTSSIIPVGIRKVSKYSLYILTLFLNTSAHLGHNLCQTGGVGDTV